MMARLLPAAFCLAFGFSLVCLGWPRTQLKFSDCLFRASLSVGFGMGMLSAVFFASLLVGVTHLFLFDGALLTILLAFFLVLRTQRSAGSFVLPSRQVRETRGLREKVTTVGSAVAFCAALYAAVMRVLAYPQGDGWDAFSIWNLHARFLFLGGAHWRDGFTPLLPWSHPDYPLLLPAAVAHFWRYLGYDDPAVPALIGFLFTFSTVALLFAALAKLRGQNSALLGATALLATPAFIEQGTAQYADVPLSFFILASVALLCTHDDLSRELIHLEPATDADRKKTIGESAPGNGLPALAGLAAGCAAWTKNEGLLFLSALIVARLLSLARNATGRHKWILAARRDAPLVLGSVPALLLIAIFKHFIAPPGDLFSNSAHTLHKLIEPARYWAIFRWYVKGFFRFGGWLLPGTLLLVAYYFAVERKKYDRPTIGIRTSWLALGFTLAGFLAVYLVTPYDIFWHLRFSLMRLFLQLWPSTVFLFFLTVNAGETSPSRAEWKRDAPDHA